MGILKEMWRKPSVTISCDERLEISEFLYVNVGKGRGVGDDVLWFWQSQYLNSIEI